MKESIGRVFYRSYDKTTKNIEYLRWPILFEEIPKLKTILLNVRIVPLKYNKSLQKLSCFNVKQKRNNTNQNITNFISYIKQTDGRILDRLRSVTNEIRKKKTRRGGYEKTTILNIKKISSTYQTSIILVDPYKYPRFHTQLLSSGEQRYISLSLLLYTTNCLQLQQFIYTKVLEWMFFFNT